MTQVIVHDANEMPDPDNDGFFASPGHLTISRIHLQEVDCVA